MAKEGDAPSTQVAQEQKRSSQSPMQRSGRAVPMRPNIAPFLGQRLSLTSHGITSRRLTPVVFFFAKVHQHLNSKYSFRRLRTPPEHVHTRDPTVHVADPALDDIDSGAFPSMIRSARILKSYRWSRRSCPSTLSDVSSDTTMRRLAVVGSRGLIGWTSGCASTSARGLVWERGVCCNAAW